HDVNYDGIITRDEVAQRFENTVVENDVDLIARATKSVMDADANKDDIVTQKEVFDYVRVENSGGRPTSSRRDKVGEYLNLSDGSDGVLTIGELNALAYKAFYTVDINQDGILDQNERRA